MPCTAKKFEIRRDDENAAGLPDVDISITTRELARLIKKAQLNFDRLPRRSSMTPWVFPLARLSSSAPPAA